MYLLIPEWQTIPTFYRRYESDVCTILYPVEIEVSCEIIYSPGPLTLQQLQDFFAQTDLMIVEWTLDETNRHQDFLTRNYVHLYSLWNEKYLNLQLTSVKNFPEWNGLVPPYHLILIDLECEPKVELFWHHLAQVVFCLTHPSAQILWLVAFTQDEPIIFKVRFGEDANLNNFVDPEKALFYLDLPAYCTSAFIANQGKSLLQAILNPEQTAVPTQGWNAMTSVLQLALNEETGPLRPLLFSVVETVYGYTLEDLLAKRLERYRCPLYVVHHPPRHDPAALRARGEAIPVPKQGRSFVRLFCKCSSPVAAMSSRF